MEEERVYRSILCKFSGVNRLVLFSRTSCVVNLIFFFYFFTLGIKREKTNRGRNSGKKNGLYANTRNMFERVVAILKYVHM